MTQPYQPQPPPAPMSLDQRRAVLAQSLAGIVHTGARVESQTDTQAVVVVGRTPNHVLHLLLTLVTCGAWGIVWVVLALTGRERRSTVLVDEWGFVHRRDR